MKNHHLSHHELFNYSISDDLIIYPALNSTDIKITTQTIGILIAKIQDWNLCLEKLNELFRYSLIDSFSIQIEIKHEIKSYLILKIIGIGSNELKFRYNNLKKRMQEEHDELMLLTHEKLEFTYLSPLGVGDRIFHESSIITRNKHFFFIKDQDDLKSYYFLGYLNTKWMSQEKEKIKFIIELLHAANIQCHFVFFSKNLGNFSQNNSYVYALTNAYSNFYSTLTEQLAQVSYPFKPINKFHPYYLGQILTRGPIEPKDSYTTKIPPILNINLDFSSQTPPLVPEITDIEYLLYDIPKKRETEGYYTLFRGKVLLFVVKKLNLTTIRLISRNLTCSFQYCIFFLNPCMITNFSLKKSKNRTMYRKLSFFLK